MPRPRHPAPIHGSTPAEAASSERATSKAATRRKRTLPKTITRDEARRLLDAPSLDYPTGLRNRCMLELMYRSGLRVGEVCALAPRDVDVAGGTIHVFDGKGGDGTAYFDVDTVRPLLERWIATRRGLRPGAGAPLFCTLNGDTVGTRYIQRMVKRMAARAGITSLVTPHVLRHTFATELLDEGFNIREVQTAVRHADVSTTMIYTHVLDTHLRDRIQRRKRR